MQPGSHTVVITTEAPRDGIQARKQGYELRDSLAIFLPGQTLHALLLRTPLSEKTVATQVLTTGTGALNIDGCRIEGAVPSTKTGQGFRKGKFTGQVGRGARGELDGQEWSSSKGRWPTNVLLIHGPRCVCQGTRKVKNVGGSTSGDSAFGQNSGWNAHN